VQDSHFLFLFSEFNSRKSCGMHAGVCFAYAKRCVCARVGGGGVRGVVLTRGAARLPVRGKVLDARMWELGYGV
jgi:hypothetical protein